MIGKEWLMDIKTYFSSTWVTKVWVTYPGETLLLILCLGVLQNSLNTSLLVSGKRVVRSWNSSYNLKFQCHNILSSKSEQSEQVKKLKCLPCTRGRACKGWHLGKRYVVCPSPQTPPSVLKWQRAAILLRDFSYWCQKMPVGFLKFCFVASYWGFYRLSKAVQGKQASIHLSARWGRVQLLYEECVFKISVL